MDRRSVSLPLLLALSLLVACDTPDTSGSSAPKGPRIMAVVGSDSIAAAQFALYSASLPDAMRSGSTPAAGRRRVLETLIDKTLLLTQARATGLDQDPEFLARMEEFRQSRLLEGYRRQHIASQIRITSAEIEQRWRETHRDRSLRFGGVMVETLAQAQEIKAQLEAGADLGELAAARSLHTPSAATGGQMTEYLAKSQVVSPIAEAIFHLAVGGVSDPVPVRGEGDGPQQLAVFQVLDEVEAPLESARGAIQKELATEKMGVRARTLRDSLIATYGAQPHDDAVQLVAAAAARVGMGDVAVSGADSARPIATYRGGQVTIGEFLEASAALHAAANTLLDPVKVGYILRDNILPTRLSLEETYAQGLDQNPALLEVLARKQEELLVSLLRFRQVDRFATASDSEARAYFDANPELFKKPDITEIVEIRVASADLAQQLKDQIEAGADAQALARTHTVREELRTTGGVVDVNRAQLADYKDIFVGAQRSPIGSIQGPVATHDGFHAVYKILRRTFVNPSFEETRVRAAAFVRIRKAKTGYVEYLQSLRDKYPVQILDEELAAAGQSTG
ncbi:MAG: hypothetical protein HN404_00255 [Gemmatimonadetes bacterium]|nr:hypothetical protein [Gemmatimonadota bacterium]